MNKTFQIWKYTALVVGAFLLLLTSCKKNSIYRDSEYPGQSIYLPAAANGIFVINSLPQRIGDVPTPGSTFQFTIGADKRKFVVPLSVYRSGVELTGSATITVIPNPDTISQMISSGAFTNIADSAELLPEGKYSVDNSIALKDGSESVSFNLEIDLDFLQNNPGKVFAIALSVSSPQIMTSPKLGTAVIVIDTRIFTPKADFTTAVSPSDDKTIVFTNNSVNGLSYVWNFGDGSDFSTETAPTHTFSVYGDHSVTLKTIGLSGDTSSVTQSFRIFENVTSQYFKNAGFPFLRSDASSDRWGILQDWSYTPNVLSQNGYTKGGFSNDDGSGYIHFESTDWAGPGLTNGKVYQTFVMAPGDYTVKFTVANCGSLTNSLDANFAVALGSMIPEIADLSGPDVLSKYSWSNTIDSDTEFTLNFSIATSSTVSIGWVVSYNEFSYLRIRGITMFR